MRNPFHIHSHNMNFTGSGLDWVLRCRCGDTCFTLSEARRRSMASSARASVSFGVVVILVGSLIGGLITYWSLR
jgi:hypothetical protein